MVNSYGGSTENTSRLLETIRPPEKTISMSGVVADYTPVGVCNGAEQSYSGTDGLVLNVHPVGNVAGSNYLMPLFAGGRNTCRFDKVIYSGSTVNMAYITLFQE